MAVLFDVVRTSNLPASSVLTPIPTLPATYKPLVGGIVLLPTETPPPLCTSSLVVPFTWARNAFTPAALFICSLELGAVVPKPHRPVLVSLPRSLLLLLNKIEKLVVVPRVPLAASVLPLVSQF